MRGEGEREGGGEGERGKDGRGGEGGTYVCNCVVTTGYSRLRQVTVSYGRP